MNVCHLLSYSGVNNSRNTVVVITLEIYFVDVNVVFMCSLVQFITLCITTRSNENGLVQGGFFTARSDYSLLFKGFFN